MNSILTDTLQFIRLHCIISFPLIRLLIYAKIRSKKFHTNFIHFIFISFLQVQKKRRIVARVQCRNIKNECPKPTCDDPILLPGRCCKTCPGDSNSKFRFIIIPQSYPSSYHLHHNHQNISLSVFIHLHSLRILRE